MKAMMATMTFERGSRGYSIHAEEDKIFVLAREYDEYTGEITDVQQVFQCGTSASEAEKLLQFLKSLGIAVVNNDSTSFDPNVTITAIVDEGDEAEVVLNLTSNTLSFSLCGGFTQFGLDEDEPEQGGDEAGGYIPLLAVRY